jgi:hypothetical protein
LNFRGSGIGGCDIVAECRCSLVHWTFSGTKKETPTEAGVSAELTNF